MPGNKYSIVLLLTLVLCKDKRIELILPQIIAR
jgi:hypothetical protein